MSATFEVHDGCTTLISDAGCARLADEQRLTRVDRLYVEVKLGALLGAVVTIAGLVVLKILGA